MKLSIGQLAKMANVTNRTLRYYEELGLIAPKIRGDNGYRYYDEGQVARLNTIKLLQEGGLELKEIASALTPTDGTYLQSQRAYGQSMARKVYDNLKVQREKIDQKKLELEKLSKELSEIMHQLESCIGCTKTTSPSECSRCTEGSIEITSLESRIKATELAASEKNKNHYMERN